MLSDLCIITGKLYLKTHMSKYILKRKDMCVTLLAVLIIRPVSDPSDDNLSLLLLLLVCHVCLMCSISGAALIWV